ncbi:MAG: class I SAM-dependent methyltransferase, partial [Chloroflexi bacterium]|nr:class I SAM-dependent methyltransferase [Chloroflexota bacterium]
MRRPTVVVCRASGYEALAEATARSLGLPVGLPVPTMTPAPGLVLMLDEAGWSLSDDTPGALVRSDFTGGEVGRRVREAPRGEGRLIRALGLKRHPAPLVLDATAGLGRESVLAAALGATVVACERSPIVALLLRDGLRRAAEAGLGALMSRVTLHEGDAREVLATLGVLPDVVLVDPMFPERTKSAKARREMQILQHLLGPDEDTEALLDAALRGARERVVV